MIALDVVGFLKES